MLEQPSYLNPWNIAASTQLMAHLHTIQVTVLSKQKLCFDAGMHTTMVGMISSKADAVRHGLQGAGASKCPPPPGRCPTQI